MINVVKEILNKNKIYVAVFVILYVAGLLSQFFDKIASLYEVTISYNPLNIIFYNFKNPAGLIIVSVIIGGLYLKKKLKDDRDAKDRNFSYSEKGTYGTSGEMTEEEFSHYLKLTEVEKTQEIILGELDNKIVCLKDKEELEEPYCRFPFNKNMAISGAPGKGKSFFFGLPFIFQLIRKKDSGIIFDPKGEYYERTAYLAEKAGFLVKVICFKTGYFKYSDGWNFLEYIMYSDGAEERASEIVSVIMSSTEQIGAKGNQFFTDGVKNLLAAGLLYVANSKSYQGKRDIGSCFDFISQTPLEILQGTFEALPKDDPAKKKWNLVNGSGAIKDIVTNLGTRLSIFGTKEINSMLSFDEIDLSLPGKQPCMYYVVVDDQSSTYSALASIFAMTATKILTDLADSNESRRLEVSTWFLFEEFPSSVLIPDFDKKLATGRSRLLNYVIIYQNLAQMQNRFRDGMWENLISLCDININLGLGSMDMTTSRYISERTGIATIDVNSTRENRSKLIPQTLSTTLEYGLNESEGRRTVMNSDEVLKIPPNQLLLLISGHNVIKLKKYDTLKHPMFKYMKEIKLKDHIPAWKVEEKIREEERASKLKKWEEEARKIEEEKLLKKKKVIASSKESIDTKPKGKKGRTTVVKEVDNYAFTLIKEEDSLPTEEPIFNDCLSQDGTRIITLETDAGFKTVDKVTGEVLSIINTKHQEDKLIKEILGDQIDVDYFNE